VRKNITRKINHNFILKNKMCKVFCNYAHLWLEFIVNYYQWQDFGTVSKHMTIIPAWFPFWFRKFFSKLPIWILVSQ